MATAMIEDEVVRHDLGSPASEAIAETRFNARKLLDDAKCLYGAHRWSTCISLSILACEEAGKFFMLNHNLARPDDHQSSIRDHKEKHENLRRICGHVLGSMHWISIFLSKAS